MEQLLKSISENLQEQDKEATEPKYTKPSTNIKPCTCNVWQCSYCNGNRHRPTKEQLEKIKIKNLNRTKPIPLKNCSFKCKYCERKIPGANKFIMDLNIDILQRIEKNKKKSRTRKRQKA